MQTSAELVQNIRHEVLAVTEVTEQPGVGDKIRSSFCQGWGAVVCIVTLWRHLVAQQSNVYIFTSGRYF